MLYVFLQLPSRAVVGGKHTTCHSFGTVSIQNSPPPPIPGRARSNCQLYVFLQCPPFGTARYYSIAIPKEGHVGGKHTLQRPGFDFVLSPFSHRKRSYFEVLIKLKKIGHTICDPFLIFKKIFSLRHHGVKLF